MRQKSNRVGTCACCQTPRDCGPMPCTVNVNETATRNCAFRAAVWTGCHLQMTVMCIPPDGEIGAEVHLDTDQYIRVEVGQGALFTGFCKERLEMRQHLAAHCAVFVPAGTWHNIRNAGTIPLKISSVYSPPHHPRGTVHATELDAEQGDY